MVKCIGTFYSTYTNAKINYKRFALVEGPVV